MRRNESVKVRQVMYSSVSLELELCMEADRVDPRRATHKQKGEGERERRGDGGHPNSALSAATLQQTELSMPAL